MPKKEIKIQKMDIMEKKIVKMLIKNPRITDMKISELTGISYKTVNRKRQKLENSGLINYYTELNTGTKGTKTLTSRHLYLIKFQLGITQEKIIKEIKEEPNVKTIFTELIYESHLAEIDGHTSLIMIIEGETDDDINIGFNSKIVPSLKKNHGKDSIINVSTIRLGKTIRIFHNYLPMINISQGIIKNEWPETAIFPKK
ncbi:MAG TPA: winged helix-turn-helix domain-containing protein [Nitrososphaerales archaeon]|nr:winged helix-turn-helix domain-containing protein [Nitrososphaerales archaeon]